MEPQAGGNSGFSRVPRGVAGTGEAVEFGTEDQIFSRISAAAQVNNQKREIQKQRAERMEKSAEFKPDLSNVFRSDYNYFKENVNKGLTKLGSLAAAFKADTGRTEGYDKPGSKYFEQAQEVLLGWEQNTKRSDDDRKFIMETQKLINSHPGEYTQVGLQKFNDWINLPTEERLNTPRPNLQNYYDPQAFLTKQVDVFAHENTRGFAGFTPEGVRSGSVSERTLEQLQELGKVNLRNPQYSDYVDATIAGLDAIDEAGKISEAGKLDMSLREYIAYEDVMGAAYKKSEANVSRTGGRGAGYADKEKNAEYMLNWMSGEVTGTASGAVPAEQHYGTLQLKKTGPTTVENIEPGRYFVNPAPAPFQYGPDAEDDVIDFIIVDQETGKVAVLNEERAPTSQEWMDKKRFFSNVLLPIAENMKEMDADILIAKAKEMGLVDEATGDVRSISKPKATAPDGW